MQYHITQQVPSLRWEHEQAAVADDIRRQAQHDLEAQHPGSTVTIDAVHHSVQRRGAESAAAGSDTSYLVDFVCEYTISGEPNTFAA